MCPNGSIKSSLLIYPPADSLFPRWIQAKQLIFLTENRIITLFEIMIYETNYSNYSIYKSIATIATIKPIATIASIATITSPGKLPRPLGRGSGGGATSGGAVSRPHQRKHHWGRRRLACGWIGTIRIITMPSGCAGVPACYKRSFLSSRLIHTQL